VQELAGCARNEHIRAGEYLFREGGTAEHFYVIMHGRIALELFSPGSGPHVLDSSGEGEVLDLYGLAPLRSVVLEVLAHRDSYGRVALLYGARTPAEATLTRARDDALATGDPQL